MKETPHLISRRSFLDRSTKGALGLVFYSSSAHSLFASPFSDSNKIPVIVVRDDAALTSSNKINSSIVQSMMDAAIRILTGINELGDAWKSLFPGITPESVIGIKINCINGKLSTHPEVTQAVIRGLNSMTFGESTFPENHIIIWDRRDREIKNAGYTINTGNTGVRCYGSDHFGTMGYTTTQYNVHGKPQSLSTILVNQIHYLINLSVMKNHNGGGVTLSMKNHYGTCNDPSALHGNYCNPYIADLNSLPPIRNKQVISICDAIFAIYSGGPSGFPQSTPKSLIVSRDPVAHDYIGSQILKSLGCKTVNLASHIHSAAEYQLGTDDPLKINQIDLANPSTQLIENPPVEKSRMVSIMDDRAYREDNGHFSIREDVVQIMIDCGILKLTQNTDVGEAWKTLFPGIQRHSIIGIKINCENPEVAAHPETIRSLVSGLKKMQIDSEPFPEENIVIWDRDGAEMSAAGFTVNRGGPGVQVYGTDGDGLGYPEPAYPVLDYSQKLSAILTREIDYLISLFVPSGNDILGVSLGLVNQSRSCENPDLVYADGGNPGLPALNHLPSVRNKHVLSICDAVFGSMGDTAEPVRISPCKIVIGKDPVACDWTATEILKAYGCITADKATYIEAAAHIPYNLGNAEAEWVEIDEILNPSRGIIEDPPDSRSEVVKVSDQRALRTAGDSTDLRSDVIQTMTDAGILALTGLENVGEAWKSLFPGIHAGSVIGIRVNCENSGPVHPEVVESVVQGLVRMNFDGVPYSEENIVVWDRFEEDLRSAGFTVRQEGSGYRCFANDSPGKGYSDAVFILSGSEHKLSRILTEEIDFCINLPSLRFHESAGIFSGLLNFTRDCEHPELISQNGYNPSAAELNKLDAIRLKTVMTLCDAIYGQIFSGNEGCVVLKSLILSRDVVAHDTMAADFLKTHGCSTTGLAAYIHTAAHYPYQLGTEDPAWIDYQNIEDPSEGIIIDPSSRVHSNDMLNPDEFYLFPNRPNPFNSGTVLEYHLPERGHVEIDIMDIRGKRIRRLFSGYQDQGMQKTTWDGRSSSGGTVPSGTYIAKFRSGRIHRTMKILMMK